MNEKNPLEDLEVPKERISFWSTLKISVVTLSILLIGVLFYIDIDLQRGAKQLRKKEAEHYDMILKLQQELSVSQSKVSILEASVDAKDKRWARIKQVRTTIGPVPNLSINELTVVASAIVEYSDEFDVPLTLVAAVMRQESTYNPLAKSPAGAIGVMQLMPATADELASELSMRYYNLHKITDNTRLGTYYLWRLLKRFNGDMELAIRAYNCGPEWTQKVLSGEFSDYPKETKEYVIKVLEYKKQFEVAGL